MRSEKETKTALEHAMKREFACADVCFVTNGTHAIEVLLTAMDLPRGARVLVPELSFFATATAVARCGLIPVFADVSRDYLGLTLESVKAQAKEPLAAVIVVHLAGFVNRELREIADFCRSLGIPLIEDCAQIHRGFYQGIRAGNVGTAATFSFQSSKLFNCGEGGAITSSDAALMTQCKAIINWGWPGEGTCAQHDIPSSNYRLSQLQMERLIAELALADQKTAALRAAYERLARAAERAGKTHLPARFSGDFIDSPFFFITTGCQPDHQLEPRGQYPMSRSSVVLAILRKWFPDLVAPYLQANSGHDRNVNSLHIVRNYCFLRIGQPAGLEAVEIELAKLQAVAS
jgi:dTDP-4-amino-4,6-dideoxygalactose transaminase